MAAVALGVSPGEFHFEDHMFTFTLASGITVADIGKAVSVDTGAGMKVKLATDNEKIFGRLEAVEDRVQEGVLIGTVSLKFMGKLPSTGTINVGDSVVGSATAGTVKAATTFTATGQAGTLPQYNNSVTVAAASNVVYVAFGI